MGGSLYQGFCFVRRIVLSGRSSFFRGRFVVSGISQYWEFPYTRDFVYQDVHSVGREFIISRGFRDIRDLTILGSLYLGVRIIGACTVQLGRISSLFNYFYFSFAINEFTSFFLDFFFQTGGSSARLHRGSSRVGFLPSQVKPPTDVPVDLTKELFDAVEDVQTFTLQPSQLAVVVASYDKTIGRIQNLICITGFPSYN